MLRFTDTLWLPFALRYRHDTTRDGLFVNCILLDVNSYTAATLRLVFRTSFFLCHLHANQRLDELLSCHSDL